MLYVTVVYLSPQYFSLDPLRPWCCGPASDYLEALLK
jgi:hypothetical protein